MQSIAIPRVRLSTDTEISCLVAGCWRLVEQSAGALKRVEAFIDHCIGIGISTFDHADIYGQGGAQALFGAALGLRPRMRDAIQLISKTGIALPEMRDGQHRVLHLNSSRSYLVETVERTLRALQTEYLDVFLIHRPDLLMVYEEVAATFTQLRKLGKVKAFGVSNFSAAQSALLQSMLPFPLVTNQIELSILETTALRSGLLDDMQRYNLVAMAWSPLGGGRLFTDSCNDCLRRVMADVAQRHGTSVAAVAIAWLLRLPTRIVPVLGTINPERLTQAAQACSLTLERADWYEIYAAAGNNFA